MYLEHLGLRRRSVADQRDYDGMPTAYGQGLEDHLATVAAAARTGRG